MKDFEFRFDPYNLSFWQSKKRYADYDSIVNVIGGIPFFEYSYWEDYCPIKHQEVKVEGYN